MASYPITLPSSPGNPLATLTHPDSEIWELELHHGQDNRITPEFVDVLGKALDLVEKDWRSGTTEDGAPGALVIVGKKSQNKFFSNGLDFVNTSKDRGFFPVIFNPLLRRLLTFPVPVVAAINGHAFAAGFLLALCADYRVMTCGKAWCSMNELTFGAPLPTSMAAILKFRHPTSEALRKTCLEAHRWTPAEILAIGMVDQLSEEPNTQSVLKAAHALAKQRAPLAKTGVWGLIKRDLARDVLLAASLDERGITPVEEAKAARAKFKL
ncbi:ClpP/crotonase [Cantharellus anzutake]|uniref:ClpP/crotonase n=1 Tax=Cantharellus anzutake TaxID=1750568 RepID=UPI001907A719|nr:ClpP/crotonase [Cantharellus anzutake]KAF8332626.1 ClpP/crotonase [Cantharellus anzutake]